MLDRKTLQALGCWTGYKLDRVVLPEGNSRTLSLYLKATSKVMYCQECGTKCNQVHETVVRRVRDLPLFDYRVVLHVPRRRVWCDQCGGPRLERLDWLGRYQRVTARLARACGQLLQSCTVQAVAAFTIWVGIRLNRLIWPGCVRRWSNRTGRRFVIWRWMNLHCIKAIVMPRWS